jgi:hypothetical protein
MSSGRLVPALRTTSVVVVSTAALVTAGCSVGNDVMAGMGLLTSETAPATKNSGAPSALTAAPQPGAQSSPLTVSSQQRGYLDALKATGVQPSSDLLALSIGSYVCQARAAKQNDQAVWAFVVPLVRGDLRTAQSNSSGLDSPPTPAEVNAATSDYIRVATQRLC